MIISMVGHDSQDREVPEFLGSIFYCSHKSCYRCYDKLSRVPGDVDRFNFLANLVTSIRGVLLSDFMTMKLSEDCFS